MGVLDRDAARAELLRERGISLWQPDSDQPRRVRVPVLLAGNPASEESVVPEWDLLVVCVKAYDVAQALCGALSHLQKEGLLLVLSNGIGNLETAHKHWPAAQCLGGTVSYGALREGSTGVRQTGEGRIRVGALEDAATGTAEVVKLFGGAGLDAEEVSDLEVVIWEKVAINCAINPLGALLALENGRLPASSAFEAGVEAAHEASAVARNKGLKLPIGGWRSRVTEVCQATSSNRCSMLVDLEAGRPTEIDALNGRVVAEGERLGVEVPANRALTRLVKALGDADWKR